MPILSAHSWVHPKGAVKPNPTRHHDTTKRHASRHKKIDNVQTLFTRHTEHDIVSCVVPVSWWDFFVVSSNRSESDFSSTTHDTLDFWPIRVEYSCKSVFRPKICQGNSHQRWIVYGLYVVNEELHDCQIHMKIGHLLAIFAAMEGKYWKISCVL